MRTLSILLVCLVAATGARAQDATPANDPRPVGTTYVAPAMSSFTAAVDLVPLNVVVTDSRQHLVGGLLPQDFAVFEDGVRQDVTFFAAGEAPLDLALLIDTSASMQSRMPVVQQAAKGLLRTLRQGDRAMIVDVKATTRIRYGLGSDLNAADEALQSAAASGSTALYTALYVTLQELKKARRASTGQVRRQAIVVLSDGVDTASLLTFDDVMTEARASSVATYTITLRGTPDALDAGRGRGRVLDDHEYGMKRLAEETGARAFFPVETRELKDIYDAIATELSHQYALAYAPPTAAASNSFRKVLVQVLDRPEFRTRTRTGYTR